MNKTGKSCQVHYSTVGDIQVLQVDQMLKAGQVAQEVVSCLKRFDRRGYRSQIRDMVLIQEKDL